MSGVVTAQIEIDAPLQRVWECMMDADRTLEWVTIVRAVGHVDPGPPTPGFRMDQTLAIHGVPFHVRWTLEQVQAPGFARWVGRGPARSTAIIEDRLSALPDGRTLVDYRNEFRTPLGPLGSVAGRVLMGGVPEHEANASLIRLKALLER